MTVILDPLHAKNKMINGEKMENTTESSFPPISCFYCISLFPCTLLHSQRPDLIKFEVSIEHRNGGGNRKYETEFGK